MNRFEPIILNEFGDAIVEYKFPVGVKDSIKENDILFVGRAIGMHETCNTVAHLLVSSKTHHVIYCHRCHLRLPMPVEVNTYTKLREWCAAKRDIMAFFYDSAFKPTDPSQTSKTIKIKPGKVPKKKNRDSMLD